MFLTRFFHFALRRTNAFALVLALFCVAAHAADALPSDMAERTRACTVCHGAQGQAGPDGYYPRIAGKPAGYLYNQLISFKQGRRHYAPMERLISTLDDAYLLEIAQYYATLSLPYPSPKKARQDASAAAHASTLVEKGDITRGLPACAQCHGKALTGTQPNIPGLLGLPADYLLGQLGGWQNKQRNALEPDCMAKVARLLDPQDISALAQWLSSQAVPTPAKAAEQLPARTPGTVDISITSWRCGTSASPASTPANASSPQASPVARGEYLARIGNCAQCHTAPGRAAYAGGRAIDTPFGAVLSSNLTPDTTYGIGSWSANDFWQALHHGTSKDGRALYPAFPYTSYTQVTREDADALFAYLKSLPASATPNQAHTLRWPFNTQIALKAWRFLFFTPAAEATQAPASGTDRGAYLVNGLGHCDECHAARNMLGALSTDAAQQGGVLPVSLWFAPSLQSGWLQRWTVPELQRFLQSGVSPHGYAAGPMAEVVLHGTRYLNDADAQAMAQHLQRRASQAVASAVASTEAPGSNVLRRGASIYDKQCADCHGKVGEGQSGAYPALAANPNVQRATINNLLLHVLYGGFPASTAGNPRPHGMPPFVLTLNDADIAAVLSYVRSSWGNQAGGVSEFDINKLRIALTRAP